MLKKTLFSSLIVALAVLPAFARQSDTSFKKYEQSIPGSDVRFAMVPVPAGSFQMGSTAGQAGAEADEQPLHKVELAAFWMGAYEVTYDEFSVFLNDISLSQNIATDAVTRPSSPYIDMTLGMGKAGGFPANSMQQFGAIMYCKWLYAKTGIFFRLPTEAEWEYACRAGSTTVYPFGDNAGVLGEYAWYSKNSDNRYHKVGQKKPNAWGLYDMLGNVGEWVLDQYQADYYASLSGPAMQPLREPSSRHPRTVRGGSYRDEAVLLRSADRLMSDLTWNRRDPQIPKSRWWNADAPFVGFRIVRPVKQPTAEEADTFFKTFLGQ
ncbi:MAG: SUMF1/EgtB/PvdO family nonheme iron enzyme [Chitinophagaceae bacterium]